MLLHKEGITATWSHLKFYVGFADCFLWNDLFDQEWAWGYGDIAQVSILLSVDMLQPMK